MPLGLDRLRAQQGTSCCNRILLFGMIFNLLLQLLSSAQWARTWFTPYCYSIVTCTALGFGDVVPRRAEGEILASIEVIIGYLTLGLLLVVLANTVVARRS